MGSEDVFGLCGIILITASLSWNTHTKDVFWLEMWDAGGTGTIPSVNFWFALRNFVFSDPMMRMEFLLAVGSHTSSTTFLEVISRILPNETNAASVLLCDKAVQTCTFLQLTLVLDINCNIGIIKSSGKSAPWIKPSLHSVAEFSSVVKWL